MERVINVQVAEVIGTVALSFGAAGLIYCAVGMERGNAAIKRNRYQSYAKLCADARRARGRSRWSA